LITVDELRAAGALDVPPAWRKSLGVERDPGLFGDQNTPTEEPDVRDPFPQISEESGDDFR
jgi:hypothetical protein